MEIIVNKIKCNSCGEIIESTHRHDYKTCKCGRVSVDGGHSYLKRAFKESLNDYTDMSIVEYSEEELKEMEAEENYLSSLKERRDENCV